MQQTFAASAALAALHTQGCDFLRVQGNNDLIKLLDASASQSIKQNTIGM
jgi:hypothetical protein